MSGQITYAQFLSNMDLVTYTLGTCVLISTVAHFLQFPQPYHTTASHPFPGDKSPERSDRIMGPSKSGRVKPNYVHI